MERTHKINNLEDLLKDHFGEAVQLVKYEAKPLTSKGENYGSEILDLLVKLKHTNNLITLKIVAKLCPPNEMLKEVFDTTVTFKKEIKAYKSILPTLLKFQEEACGRSCEKMYAECFGTRVSLNPKSNNIDDDAVLLLENLKLSEFMVKDRMKGFDLEETKLALEALSTFHTVPLVLRIKRPEVFAHRILPFLTRNTVFDIVNDEIENIDMNFFVETATSHEQCKKHIDRIVQGMKIGLRSHRKVSVREPYATISHNDFWINNILLKNGDRKCKIIDFQLMDYGSVADDLLFFLFTSVQEDVLNSHIDYLINYYYTVFIDKLKELKCDTEQFTLESFMEEIDFCAKNKQFYHIMAMLKFIFAVKDCTKDITDITLDDLSSNDYLSPECTQRVLTTILQFEKHHWI